MKPCQCGGSNESCGYCFGSGFLLEQEPQAPISFQPGERPATPEEDLDRDLPAAERARGRCRYCRQFILREKLDEHLKEGCPARPVPGTNAELQGVRVWRAPATSDAKQPEAKSKFRPCRYCGKPYHELKISVHESERCAKRPQEKTTQPKKRR